MSFNTMLSISGLTLQTLFWTTISSGVIYGSYFFFKRNILKHGAEMSSQIITSNQTQVATQQLIKNLMTSTTTSADTNQFIVSILADAGVQAQMKATLITLFETQEMKDSTNQLVISILKDNSVQTELRQMVSGVIRSLEVQKDLNDLLTCLLKNPETKELIGGLLVGILEDDRTANALRLFLKKDETIMVLNQIIHSLIENEKTHRIIQEFLVETLKNANLKGELYTTIKGLLEDVMRDSAFHEVIVKFLSQIFMRALDEPVNEKYIKDKIIELMTSKDIMDSVSLSIIEVVHREDLKKAIGDNAVGALVPAIRKQYPKLTKWGVI